MSNNHLSIDKKIAVTAALAEGSSIRSIERMTGVHRDTIMRLGVRVGQGCARLLDAKMRNLNSTSIQVDEIWGFVGKKDKNLKESDNIYEVGSVWTFCAIDSDTKIVPSFLVGRRDSASTQAFINDLASRLKNRIQLASDGFAPYVEAVEQAWGSDVDYGQIVKSYDSDEGEYTPERKYSPPKFVKLSKYTVSGNPDLLRAHTGHVERLNASTRLHVKRLNRLTLAFSKKRERPRSVCTSRLTTSLDHTTV
jgi:IS1 family transposase